MAEQPQQPTPKKEPSHPPPLLSRNGESSDDIHLSVPGMAAMNLTSSPKTSPEGSPTTSPRLSPRTSRSPRSSSKERSRKRSVSPRRRHEHRPQHIHGHLNLLPEEIKTEKKVVADKTTIDAILSQRRQPGRNYVHPNRHRHLQTLNEGSSPFPPGLHVDVSKDITPPTVEAILNDIAPNAWPLELILVRHGQSEGNEATARSEKGDMTPWTPEFRAKHSSSYRLTDKGILQAKTTGTWIKENIGDKFDRYYTSEYVRAMETAALLDLPDAKWYTEIVLRERDKGQMDNTSAVDKKTIFKAEMERRKRDAFFWAPPGGESLAQICVRIDHTLNTLRRDCSHQRVIIVCHGEVMWAFRVRIERLSQIRFHQLINSSDPKDTIHNTQVIHYSRVNPKTGQILPDFRFVRSSCPWRPEYSQDEWVEFERPMYSNEELLESVGTVPRFVNNLDTKEDKPENNY